MTKGALSTKGLNSEAYHTIVAEAYEKIGNESEVGFGRGNSRVGIRTLGYGGSTPLGGTG